MNRRIARALALLVFAALLSGCPNGPDPYPAEDGWQSDTVFYHIWVKAFANGTGNGTVTDGKVGTLDGITAKLDLLNDGDPATTADLGVTGLWLSPIFKCAYTGTNVSSNMHGYDTTDYRAINPLFGTEADLRELLDAAHARGIRVIFDFVPNHTSDSHPWFQNSASGSGATKRDWYLWRTSDPGWTSFAGSSWHQRSAGNWYYGVFWSGMPDLNYGNADVRAEMNDTLRHWLDFGFDGARLDAVRYIYENGPSAWQDQSETHQWFQTVQKDVLKPYAAAGKAKMMVGEAWADWNTVKRYGPDDGKAEFDMNFDFEFRGLVDEALAGNATNLSSHLEELNDGLPSGYDIAPFLSNHDEAGNRPMTSWGSAAKAIAGASVSILGAGPAFIYYGNEIGQTDAAVSGDIRHRYPLNWATWESQSADPGSILSWHRYFLRAKNAYGSLRTGSYTDVSPTASVLAYLREGADADVLVVTNFGSSAVSASINLAAATSYRGAVSTIIGSDADTGDSLATGSLQVNSLPAYGTRVIVLAAGKAVIHSAD